MNLSRGGRRNLVRAGGQPVSIVCSFGDGHMNKRLRKKRRRGEFAEWGRRLMITRNRKDGFDEFLDAFIEQAVEANDCYCGGGGVDDRLDVVLELGRRADEPDARFRKIVAWLDARPDVQQWKASELFDLWYGDFDAIDRSLEHAQ